MEELSTGNMAVRLVKEDHRICSWLLLHVPSIKLLGTFMDVPCRAIPRNLIDTLPPPSRAFHSCKGDTSFASLERYMGMLSHSSVWDCIPKRTQKAPSHHF